MDSFKNRINKQIQKPNKQNDKPTFYREVATLFIGGFLTLAASLITVHFGKNIDKSFWEEQAIFQLNQNLINLKISLVERTVQILNKVDYLSLNSMLENNESVTPKEISEYRKIITELNSEFMTVISLNNIYFGKEVNEEAKKIMDATKNNMDWWQVDEQLRKNYMSALSREIGNIFMLCNK